MSREDRNKVQYLRRAAGPKPASRARGSWFLQRLPAAKAEEPVLIAPVKSPLVNAVVPLWLKAIGLVYVQASNDLWQGGVRIAQGWPLSCPAVNRCSLLCRVCILPAVRWHLQWHKRSVGHRSVFPARPSGIESQAAGAFPDSLDPAQLSALVITQSAPKPASAGFGTTSKPARYKNFHFNVDMMRVCLHSQSNLHGESYFTGCVKLSAVIEGKLFWLEIGSLSRICVWSIECTGVNP